MADINQFDHPCKNTCSGWRQGYEKGQKSVSDSTTNFLDFLDKNPEEAKDLKRFINSLEEMSVERLDLYNQTAKLLKGFLK